MAEKLVVSQRESDPEKSTGPFFPDTLAPSRIEAKEPYSRKAPEMFGCHALFGGDIDHSTHGI